MTTFHLTVVTPDGCAFDGQAERVVCRAIDGDLAILAKHGDYCTALGMGEAHIVDADGQRRRAACMGGMLSVLDGEVRLVATTWEWAEEIDQARAEASKKRAEEILAQKNLDKRDYEMAQARLKRALVRTSVHCEPVKHTPEVRSVLRGFCVRRSAAPRNSPHRPVPWGLPAEP